MSDLTVYAESLIATVARAFYEDDAVMVIDVLLRDKFLRDDDMSPRLSLPAKQLRQTLQFLQNEHLVKFELVDDLSTGGSQATKFWYIDYNHAVNAIRLRIYLLRTKLEKDELQARSNSYYACPGFHSKPPRCNGKYDETEAQQIVDPSTGLFLCHECITTYENDPSAPPVETYTLRLIDNKKDLRAAMDNMRRVNVQLSSKTIGSRQLRESIYDLLQKVRDKGKGPLSSNLPSENFSLGIGTKRLEGTGRTASIKAKKRAQQGVIESNNTTKQPIDDLTFLRNAIGQEIAFKVVKGGGARASLLATNRQRRQKLMDAAASRVGSDLPVIALVLKRKREKEEMEQEKKKNKSVSTAPISLDFLEDNIGLSEREAELEEERQRQIRLENENAKEKGGDLVVAEDVIVLDDGIQEMQSLPDKERRAKFQALYQQEMERQAKELDLSLPQLATEVEMDVDDSSVTWEDG